MGKPKFLGVKPHPVRSTGDGCGFFGGNYVHAAVASAVVVADGANLMGHFSP